jgi:hypothetical protein
MAKKATKKTKALKSIEEVLNGLIQDGLKPYLEDGDSNLIDDITYDVKSELSDSNVLDAVIRAKVTAAVKAARG